MGIVRPLRKKGTPETALTRSLREALADVVDPELAGPILKAALGLAGEPFVPERPSRTQWFLEEPLRMALSHFLGESEASRALAEIPLEDLFGSHVRARTPATKPAPVRPLRPAVTPLPLPKPRVLVASRDIGSIKHIAFRLVGRAEVVPVPSFTILRDRLAQAVHAPILVLDGCAVAVDVEPVIWLALDADPAPKRILVWGSRPRPPMFTPLPQPAGWTELPATAQVGDVVSALEEAL